MASVSGTSSGSSSLNLNSDQDNLQQSNTITEIRKRKRMLSNRESARRSRMRKQKHLDDLTAEIYNLRAENNQIISNTNHVTQMYLNMESENSVLRAQMTELTQRLKALNDIISCLGSAGVAYDAPPTGFDDHMMSADYCGDYDDDQMINCGVDGFLNSWSLINQPIYYGFS